MKKTASAKKATKKSAAKKSPAKKSLVRRAPAKLEARPRARERSKVGPRADFGAPIEGFFARQPATLRALLEKLRTLVEEAAPEAESSLKWGMPVYAIDGTMMCALGGHKAHVNLILSGPPGAYADPQGRLEGEGKTGRHLRLTSLDELPLAAVRGWLKKAAVLARKKG